MILRTLACLLLVAWLPFVSQGADAGPDAGAAPVVAAAADLRFALDEMVARFRADTGKEIRASYGSSGEFTFQIEQGAPFELFLSADESYVFRLADAGLTRDRGTLYAVGRLAIFAPRGSALRVDAELRDLRAALAEGRIVKFAIANPDHAPYGRAAREVLQRKALWDAIQPLLVLGENASQAAQFASAGSAQGGLIPWSLAIAPAVAALGESALVPDSLHEPLRQRMVLLKGAGKDASAFYDWLQQPAARAILERFGFALPSDPP
jgi:molybdate transport system substrate-binding protein